MTMETGAQRPITLILAGGLALGAYEAGAYAALHEAGLEPLWVAGSSIGAMNGAIIAGNPPERRMERLRQFWEASVSEVAPALMPPEADPWRHGRNWLNAVGARLGGSPGLFRLRGPLDRSLGDTSSLYDTSRAEQTLRELIDWDYLNGGAVRFTAAATDLESGEAVIFDTGAGDRIEVRHLLASGALIPEFQPVRLDDRLLGDGGLSMNVPLEPVLLSARESLHCFVIDLFSADGRLPRSLEDASERRTDLLFANQTRLRLESFEREWLARSDAPEIIIDYLSYRAPAHEAGSEKQFDHSRETLTDRWEAGALDMEAALTEAPDVTGESRLCVRKIRR